MYGQKLTLRTISKLIKCNLIFIVQERIKQKRSSRNSCWSLVLPSFLLKYTFSDLYEAFLKDFQIGNISKRAVFKYFQYSGYLVLELTCKLQKALSFNYIHVLQGLETQPIVCRSTTILNIKLYVKEVYFQILITRKPGQVST